MSSRSSAPSLHVENPTPAAAAQVAAAVDVPSVASVEVLLKTTTEEEMLALAVAAAAEKQAATPEPQAPLNPFLAPSAEEYAAATTAAPSISNKSRQNHVFLDSNGKEKKFGSALGLLTARFIDMILVRVCSLLGGVILFSKA